MMSTADRTLAMIDKHINADTFSRVTTQIHHDGIAKAGKSYKQHSHTVLVEAFFKLIDHHNVSTLLEIGAFQAEVSRRFINKANTNESATRQALAVEANPYNYKKFKDSLTEAGVIYHHAAVQDREGTCELQLHVTELDIENGYIRGNNSILKSDTRPDTRIESVPGTTLDALVASYVASESIPDPVASHPALWIDVEGALDLVIKGGHHTLKNSLAIFAEVETQRLWNDQAIFTEIAAQLDKLGFFPYLRDCEYEPEQFNVMFVNRELINTDLLEDIAAGFYNELKPES